MFKLFLCINSDSIATSLQHNTSRKLKNGKFYVMKILGIFRDWGLLKYNIKTVLFSDFPEVSRVFSVITFNWEIGRSNLSYVTGHAFVFLHESFIFLVDLKNFTDSVGCCLSLKFKRSHSNSWFSFYTAQINRQNNCTIYTHVCRPFVWNVYFTSTLKWQFFQLQTLRRLFSLIFLFKNYNRLCQWVVH